MPAGLPSMPSDAIASYHFSVEIDGVELAQFSELSGITSEIDPTRLGVSAGSYTWPLGPG